MGAWIEITVAVAFAMIGVVAPYMGAWIEIANLVYPTLLIFVAPYMGAWIEITQASPDLLSMPSRSLHGSVD